MKVARAKVNPDNGLEDAPRAPWAIAAGPPDLNTYRRFNFVRAAALLLPLLAGPAGAESLADAVRAAVTTNPAGRAANFDVQASVFELLELKREFAPTLSLYGEAGVESVDAPARLSAMDNGDLKTTARVGIAAELVLFDGYRRSNMVYDRAARVDGAIFRLLDASETMALNAVEAYVDVHRHRALLDAAVANVVRHREIKGQVADLVDSGRLPLSDGFEVEERVLAARMAELEVRQALADAEARYKSVVGHAPRGGLSVPGATGLPGGLEKLTATAVGNSFQVKYATTQVQQTHYARGIGKADTLPEVKLRAGVDLGTNLNGSSGDETDAFVGVQLNWDFYTGGRKARGQAYSQRTRQAMADRDRVVREVQEAAARAWNAYQAAQGRVRLLNQQAAANRKLASQYRDQFEAGTRTLLDVLEAQRSQFNTRSELISAEAAVAFGGYRLLAVQSKLSGHFGLQPADMPLDPNFQDRAKAAPRPSAIFNTEIRALE